MSPSGSQISGRTAECRHGANFVFKHVGGGGQLVVAVRIHRLCRVSALRGRTIRPNRSPTLTVIGDLQPVRLKRYNPGGWSECFGAAPNSTLSTDASEVRSGTTVGLQVPWRTLCGWDTGTLFVNGMGRFACEAACVGAGSTAKRLEVE